MYERLLLEATWRAGIGSVERGLKDSRQQSGRRTSAWMGHKSKGLSWEVQTSSKEQDRKGIREVCCRRGT